MEEDDPHILAEAEMRRKTALEDDLDHQQRVTDRLEYRIHKKLAPPTEEGLRMNIRLWILGRLPDETLTSSTWKDLASASLDIADACGLWRDIRKYYCRHFNGSNAVCATCGCDIRKCHHNGSVAACDICGDGPLTGETSFVCLVDVTEVKAELEAERVRQLRAAARLQALLRKKLAPPTEAQLRVAAFSWFGAKLFIYTSRASTANTAKMISLRTNFLDIADQFGLWRDIRKYLCNHFHGWWSACAFCGCAGGETEQAAGSGERVTSAKRQRSE